jgi:hypothetical protein
MSDTNPLRNLSFKDALHPIQEIFFKTFSRQEYNRLLKKIMFAYTPNHASWLNMPEIEINLLDHECLGRSIGNSIELERQIIIWCKVNYTEK